MKLALSAVFTPPILKFCVKFKLFSSQTIRQRKRTFRNLATLFRVLLFWFLVIFSLKFRIIELFLILLFFFILLIWFLFLIRRIFSYLWSKFTLFDIMRFYIHLLLLSILLLLLMTLRILFLILLITSLFCWTRKHSFLNSHLIVILWIKIIYSKITLSKYIWCFCLIFETT